MLTIMVYHRSETLGVHSEFVRVCRGVADTWHAFCLDWRLLSLDYYSESLHIWTTKSGPRTLDIPGRLLVSSCRMPCRLFRFDCTLRLVSISPSPSRDLQLISWA